jgi:hypothetical protein
VIVIPGGRTIRPPEGQVMRSLALALAPSMRTRVEASGGPEERAAPGAIRPAR